MSTLDAMTLPAPLRTPLIRRDGVWVKAESEQRTGSAKYRMVYAKVLAALTNGAIAGHTTLTAITSGSTGIALAYVGRRLRLRVELHARNTIQAVKRRKLESEGAHLILHPPHVGLTDLLREVRRQAHPGSAWHLDQFDRRSIVASYRELGRELFGQLLMEEVPSPRTFICPVGTGGLIQGVGGILRDAFPRVRVVALEPRPGETIDGTRNTDLLYDGENDSYDRSFPDEVARVRRPIRPVKVGATILGESSSAAYLWARSRQTGPVIVMSPD